MPTASHDTEQIFTAYSRNKPANGKPTSIQDNLSFQDLPLSEGHDAGETENSQTDNSITIEKTGENGSPAPEQFDLNTITEEQANLVYHVFEHGTDDAKLSLAKSYLKSPLDLTKTNKTIWIVVTLFSDILTDDEVNTLIPNEINPLTLSIEGYRVFGIFWMHSSLRQNLINTLPSQIDFTTNNWNAENLLSKIIADGFAQDILNRISNNLELSNINASLSQIVIKLIKSGFAQEIVKRLPERIEYSSLSLGAVWVIVELIEDDEIKNLIISRLVPIMSLGDLQDGLILAKYLMEKEPLGYIAELLLRSPRHALHIESYDSQLPGDYFTTQLAKLRNNTILTGKFGSWEKYRLNKSGSNTDIFVNERDKKIVFRLEGMLPQELKEKREALLKLPEYVTGPIYIEQINEDRSNGPRMNERQRLNREVFSGIALGLLNLDLFPIEVKKSILEQRNYIHLKMQELGILHDHPHDMNFNVRFLVTQQSGQKKVIFEPKEAFELAVQPGNTITPIVTIRDWDKASLRVNKFGKNVV